MTLCWFWMRENQEVFPFENSRPWSCSVLQGPANHCGVDNVNYVTQLESALINYFPFPSVDPLSVSSFPSPQTSSGTRKFTETRRRCGFLWKMWTAKSSYITSTFCWRASLRQMSTRWSSLSLCSSRFPLNILSGSYQTSGWVRIFGSLSTSILFMKHSFLFFSEENSDTDVHHCSVICHQDFITLSFIYYVPSLWIKKYVIMSLMFDNIRWITVMNACVC